MVYSKILFIRGVVVSEQALRVLIGHRFIDIWNDWVEAKTEYNPDVNVWQECASELGIRARLTKKMGVDVITWPCCSKLNHKKYIIGTVVETVDINNDMFNNVISPPKITADIDSELLEKLMRYGDYLDVELSTVMMIDDCTTCS